MPGSPLPPPFPADRGLPVRARRGRRGAAPQPFRQGQLDGLCGLYAAVNALVLLFARCGTPFYADDCYQLFRIVLDRVAPAGELAATVAEGVDRELWRDAVAAMAGHAADVSGCGVQIERPFAEAAPRGASELHDAIEAALGRGGARDTARRARPLHRHHQPQRIALSAVRQCRPTVAGQVGVRAARLRR